MESISSNVAARDGQIADAIIFTNVIVGIHSTFSKVTKQVIRMYCPYIIDRPCIGN